MNQIDPGGTLRVLDVLFVMRDADTAELVAIERRGRGGSHARTGSGHDIETSPNLDDDAAGHGREAVGPTRWSRIVTATR